jgi:phosphate transport system substrate-binding protein
MLDASIVGETGGTVMKQLQAARSLRIQVWRWAVGGVVATLALVLGLHSRGDGQTTSSNSKVRLEGAGATFPALLYKKWIALYTEQHPDVVIDYKDVGSGDGVRRFLARSVDFGASDGALTDEQMATVTVGARVVPVTAGMVVLAYNVGGLGGDLKLSRDVYTEIFLHRILKWNDPRIQALNPALHLPDHNIVVAARQDGSGTTFAMSNHLSAINADWRQGPGTGYVVDWGHAMRARGNEGVAALIKQSEGSLGYVEYAFAKRLGLPMAQLQNRAGRYVVPNDRSGQAALASSVKQMPENLRLFLPDPDGEESYPIVSFSWLLLYQRYDDQQKSAALKQFIRWGLSLGQSYSPELGYVPLPTDIASLSLAALDRIR